MKKRTQTTFKKTKGTHLNDEFSHEKKRPEDLKIQKPLSLYPTKFDEAVDILLTTKPKKRESKKELKGDSVPIEKERFN